MLTRSSHQASCRSIPTLCAFKADRPLLEEARSLITAKASFAIESALTYIALIREAKARGYRFLLHYIVIGAGAQAVARMALRIKLGGHHVTEDDILRHFERSGRHFVADYSLADKWVLWDNQLPPHRAERRHLLAPLSDLQAMLASHTLQEAPPPDMSEMVRFGLETGHMATEKMPDYTSA